MIVQPRDAYANDSKRAPTASILGAHAIVGRIPVLASFHGCLESSRVEVATYLFLSNVLNGAG
jgi:hypothetical protein